MSTAPACAKASVTIANAIPATRRLTKPRTFASTNATAIVKSTASQKLQCQSVMAMFERYTPIAMYRAWPNESRPVYPNWRS